MNAGADLIPGYFDGRHILFEDNEDGTVDAVLVDRFGFELDRAEGATRADAEARLDTTIGES